jgi:hypothetical protein
VRVPLLSSRAIAFLVFSCPLVVLGVSFAAPREDKNKGWIDYDDLTEAERMKTRPGNYQVLAALSDFLEAIHQVRPDYTRCAFPFQENSNTYEGLDDMRKVLDESAKRASAPKNKLRKYNITIKSLVIHDADTVAKAPDKILKLRTLPERFVEVRKRHPGRAVVVLANIDLESLHSSKIENSGDFLFYLLYGDKGWKVAWYEY